MMIKQMTPEDLGDAEDKMTMGNLFEDLSAQPFAKLDNFGFIVTRRFLCPGISNAVLFKILDHAFG